MAVEIQRPIFYEGQILESVDLDRLLAYSRDQDARHERYLHTWGIGDGLEVKKLQPSGQFVLHPGFAVDSSGAPIIVSEPIVLDLQQLNDEALINQSKDHRRQFPVFVARTETERNTRESLRKCSTNGAARKSEGVAVRFRPIATGWDEQNEVGIEEGPFDRAESDRVVLIGFVTWEKDGTKTGKIAEFNRSHERDGISPRFAGVRADAVVARGGTLTLRSQSPGTRDAPMVVIDQLDDQNAFILGLDNGQGLVNEVLTVDAKGNVYAKGNIEADGALKGKIRSGEVYVESGLATDGVVLPLPNDIPQEQVDRGEVVLHVCVTPRIDPATAPSDKHLPLIRECAVDENRAVRCTICWFKPGGSDDPAHVAGTVNYLIVASVAGAKEGA